MFTREDIKALSDDKLIVIANVMKKHRNWKVDKTHTKKQQIFEVAVLNEDGEYDGVTQFLFGEQYGDEPRYLIKYFDGEFEEFSPSDEELEQITEIILA